MKKILLALTAVFVLALTVQAQPEMDFERTTHDFGTLKQHGDATYEFMFTNTGNEALIIQNAKGSCGCTVPEWPRYPIEPGKTDKIKVKYDSKRLGPINKSVTIKYPTGETDAEGQPVLATEVLRIKGKIEAAPKADESAMPVKEPTMAPSAN